MTINPLLVGGLLVAGALAGYFLRFLLATRSRASLEHKLKEEKNRAERETKEIIVAAKEQAATILADVQKDERERKQELRSLEERLRNKEDALDKDRSTVEADRSKIRTETEKLEQSRIEMEEARARVVKELETVAGLSKDDAKTKLFSELEETYRNELGEAMARFERERHDQLNARAAEVVVSTIQRYAREHIADVTSTTVEIPNEEIKGKIIGREGRNIRAFERLTGVEVIVDETPESILLSSFDPLRRELAKMALQKLVRDGRIQPAKIEEKVEEARQELDDRIRTIGEEAAYEIGVLDLPKELSHLLGKLNFRTSYGQNVLQHSIEMAHISGMIAAELGCNVAVAKKAALLHDIGKAIDHDVDGTHVELGRKLLKKYGIEEEVIRGMESHHDEYPYSTPESYIVATADVISAARPGARRDTLEKYLRRLEDIEKVVNQFDGVRQSYAVAAGREVRVFVVPEKIDDFAALQLAKQIAAKIQSEVQYPGEIKVTVIREVKAVEYAR